MQEQVTKVSHEKPRVDPYRTLGRSVRKEIQAYSKDGIYSDSENYINDIIDGFVTQYIISKTDHSIKSRKTYFEGKLHGESVIFNANAKALEREVYGLGKLVYKYLFDEALEVVGIEMIDKASMTILPTAELEILKDLMADKPEWFE